MRCPQFLCLVNVCEAVVGSFVRLVHPLGQCVEEVLVLVWEQAIHKALFDILIAQQHAMLVRGLYSLHEAAIELAAGFPTPLSHEEP